MILMDLLLVEPHPLLLFFIGMAYVSATSLSTAISRHKHVLLLAEDAACSLPVVLVGGGAVAPTSTPRVELLHIWPPNEEEEERCGR